MKRTTVIHEITGTTHGCKLFVKRDDLIDEHVSGNKLYKLSLNIQHAVEQGVDRVLTFGGAYSNHIAATAAYCSTQGLKSIGIIRGERALNLNPTLAFACAQGMELHHIERAEYSQKNDAAFIEQLALKFNQPYIIPEGGANLLGIEGAQMMLNEQCEKFDFIVTAMGTGTTFAGLVRAAGSHQKVIGIPIHKHEKLLNDILEIDPSFAEISKSKYEIIGGYHTGGYAKWNTELTNFITTFYQNTGIKLDPIYTGKAMFALHNLLEKKHFPIGSKILFIHTGGLQGIAGFEQRFGLKLFP